VVWLAGCAGSACGGGEDLPDATVDAAEAEATAVRDDAGAEAPGDVAADAGTDAASDAQAEASSDVQAEIATEVDNDLTPAAPLFERGDILPPDSLACMNLETGREQLQCNHHGSSVAVDQDGTVLAVWYHGIAEKSKDSRIVWSRRPPGGEWSPVEVLFDEPMLAEGNPVIWVREDGTYYLFFVTIMGVSWNDAEIRLITSNDRGAAWSGVTVLREEWTWMTRNHPLRMSSGELLLPCYSESLYEPSFLVSGDDYEESWDETGALDDPQYILDHLASIQPSVIQRDDGTLFALMRNTGVSATPHAFEMTSADFGRTWTESVEGPVPNDGTGIEMVALQSGRVMLAFNNTFSGRYPLSLALSDDEGKSWQHVQDLDGPCETGDCSHGYTSIAQDPADGSVWVTFTNERKTIGWVHTNEEWMLQQNGSFVSAAE
jgi:predicted neuraminidase